MSHLNRIRRAAATTAAVLAATALTTLGTAAPASAWAPVVIVHTEQVTAGPYQVTVGFSTWPIRAMRSLDFTFMPTGGIADKKGRLAITSAAAPARSGSGSGADNRSRDGRPGQPLVRHPRQLTTWGLDIQALNNPGIYDFAFAIDGPQGHGEGTLSGIAVLDQPGPPLALSWTIATLPAVGLIALIVIAWLRVRPGRRPLLH
jgi:hypothetical protein